MTNKTSSSGCGQVGDAGGLPLFDGPDLNSRPALLVGFEEYDEKHPEIWDHFKSLALELIDHGVEHWGAKAIFEVIRHGRAVRHGDHEFKVNNNFTGDYARKFHSEFPQHDGFFETRGKK